MTTQRRVRQTTSKAEQAQAQAAESAATADPPPAGLPEVRQSRAAGDRYFGWTAVRVDLPVGVWLVSTLDRGAHYSSTAEDVRIQQDWTVL